MGQDKDFSYHKAVAILATAFRILLRTKQLSNCAASFCSVLEINRPLSISNQCLAYRTISAGSRCSNAAGMLSDSPLLNGVRWQAITFMQAGSLFGAVIIAVWTIPKGLLLRTTCLTCPLVYRGFTTHGFRSRPGTWVG